MALRSPRFVAPCAQVLFCAAAALVVQSALAQPAQPTAAAPTVAASLDVHAFQPIQLDVPASAPAVLTLDLIIEGCPRTLVLARHSLRTSDFRVRVQSAHGAWRESPAPPCNTYRGRLADDPSSHAAASIRNGTLFALLSTEERAWAIQPLPNEADKPDRCAHAIYRIEDVDPRGWLCGNDFHPSFDTDEQPPTPTGGPRSDGDTYSCQIAFDADHEFYQLNNASVADTVADIEMVLNAVDLIYRDQVGIVYTITEILVRTGPVDPYTTADPEALLVQFRDHWRIQQNDIPRDVAHLMTGRDLIGEQVGVAWVGGVCSVVGGYGLSQSQYSPNLVNRAAVTAHELGHNWNAVHCDGDDDCYLMCSRVGDCANVLDQFGSRATDQILAFRDASNCLIVIPACTPPVFIEQPTSQEACAGDTLILQVRVDTPLPEYQWLHGSTALTDDGVHIIGSTAASLALLDVSPEQTGNYCCVVTNTFGDCTSVSGLGSISVSDYPTITTQPIDQTAPLGDSVDFSVGADFSLNYAYQWRKDGEVLVEDDVLTGSHEPILSLSAVRESDAGEYDCVITSLLGGCETPSDTALLEIGEPQTCPADINQDGAVDFDDLNLLLAAYGASTGSASWNPAADLDGDGTIAFPDLSMLLSAYEARCR